MKRNISLNTEVRPSCRKEGTVRVRRAYHLSGKEGGQLGMVVVAYVWRRHRSDALWWVSTLEDILGAFGWRDDCR